MCRTTEAFVLCWIQTRDRNDRDRGQPGVTAVRRAASPSAAAIPDPSPQSHGLRAPDAERHGQRLLP